MAIFHAGKWWNDPQDRTDAERAELFGDATYNRYDGADEALVSRFRAGLPMTIDGRRKARKLIRDGKRI